jgi:uncharacterized protein YndB with AHSA1/START domain
MTDRIEKEVFIGAPRSRVWKAISDKSEFGTWFGATLGIGTFAPAEEVKGNITLRGYEHVLMTMEVVEVEPESRMSYRWHPYAIDPNVDYSAEPKTLVTFTLEDAPDGTLLRVTESGFEHIPLHRRAEALKMNDGGWAAQMENVKRHVTASD